MNSSAHPLAQGRVEVIVFPDHITLWARVSVEQVIVQQLLPTGDDAKVETPSAVYRKHGDYPLQHLLVKADGKSLIGKLQAVTEPDQKAHYATDSGREFVTYEIEYTLNAKPTLIELSQDVLNEVDYTPGNRWEATYVTGIRQDQKPGLDNLYLSSQASLPFSCDWSAPKVAKPTEPAPVAKAEAPARLKEPVPESANSARFILGLVVGVGLIFVLAMLARRIKRNG